MADDQSAVPVPQGIIEVTAFMPDARNDPHPKLKALREECPVMRDDLAKAWFLTRYGDIRETVNDRTFVRHPLRAEDGSISRQLVDDEENPRRTSILFLDEPDHSRVRPPLARAFYTRIQKMKPQIEAIIDDTINAAPASGLFDLMAEIAVPIPVLVIARILGVDEHRLPEFRQWSEDVILGLNPVRTAEETARMESGSIALDGYFNELMAARRTTPGDDLITDMVQLQARGDAPLTDDEIVINLGALLVGGNLTTTDLIGNGVWLFLKHPDQLAALKADPGLASQAVEEVLRYEAPVSATSRILEHDRDVAGCPMKQRQVVFCSLAAANRDPETFAAPEAFDITQKRASHIAFGGGPHICIGAPLARIEARRVYLKLFERYPGLALPEQDFTWRALPFFRGLETLMVEA
ncbi:cytochrome P450 [Hyphomonas johnsonii]|uniref:Cytochrome P450 family protein n=1 Tax=Hyphomonas johnsonii MHS-2 TaxID=1280950 RepID=A0A059FQE5_9PROT|nr:cytochrome P450 [Hyphomonas johnsonii]KCZ92837.1 cytochrome P450 family protein [Hyphomonas johnsonii MHS-2]